MNLIDLLEKGLINNLFIEIEHYNIRNLITRELIHLKDSIKNKKHAQYDHYFRKVNLHKEFKNNKSWYNEHIINTSEHFIANLFIIALHVINSNKSLYEKTKETRILNLPIEFLLNSELHNVIFKANEQYDIINNVEKEFDNAIYAMYEEYKGNLLLQAYKLLGFLAIVSGNLNVEPIKYIKICLLNYYNLNEDVISNTNT